MTQALVIFDLDGTLFKTETVTVPAALRAMAELGLPPVPPARVISLIGEPSRAFYQKLIVEAPSRNGVPEELALRLEKLSERYEGELAATQGELYDGVPELLESLSSLGLELALCSNGGPDYCEAVLAALGLRRYFAQVLGFDPGRDKAQRVGDLVAESGRRPAIVVGDRHSDIAAAHSNGLPIIAVEYGYSTDGELAEADYKAARPADIVSQVIVWKKRLSEQQ
ncbi:MAG: HAD family hydrolase [Thermoflexales bacterium]|nr:HAD family hydrolase [Thermoflexales bacterium]